VARIQGKRDPLGGVFVAGAALLFGGVVVVGKTEAVQAIPVSSMLAIRFAVAAAALTVILSLTRGSLRPAPGEWRWLLILGGIGYATEAAFFFLALGRGTAATVTLLFYTYREVWTSRRPASCSPWARRSGSRCT
jgi:drug/metabolite transporter (DMT)-like permease